MNERIARFLARPLFAVVGASNDRDKYGNKVLRCYLQHDREVIPVNPSGGVIEGVRAVETLTDLGRTDVGVSVITPPHVSMKILEEAHALGIRDIWFQPGAANAEVAVRAENLDMNVIHSGPCVLIELGYDEV